MFHRDDRAESRAGPHAYSFIRLIGSGYLLYLGVGLWLGAGRGEGLMSVTAASDPKVRIFFLAFLPQFVDPARGPVGLHLALARAR